MISKDSRKVVGEYVFLSKYSQTHNGVKETWDEAVNRVMTMHWNRYKEIVNEADMPEFERLFGFAEKLYHQQHILGAQRALQYGGELMLEKHARFYNCSSTYIDRVEVFEEIMYLLLCGAGTGYSVQHIHTEQLPIPKGFNPKLEKKIFVIPDTIEGWAKAAGELIGAYYYGRAEVLFDYSQIRPKGAYIRGGFRAPGPEPLREALDKVRSLLCKVQKRKLRPFELHYIICVLANSVVTGGVRRSAMISIFDADDVEMAGCKVGAWISTHPELCRSNNSAAILPNTPKETFDMIYEFTRKFGEPGFVFIDSPWFVYNPCGEVGMYPRIQDENGAWKSGWGFCNLSEINGGKIQTEQDFYDACVGASVICTLQAGYTNFKVLQPWSQKIAERDALIGVGITGLCENPDLLFDPIIQRKGAMLVKETNQKIARMIGINSAARCTVVKPSGNSSQLLGKIGRAHV